MTAARTLGTAPLRFAVGDRARLGTYVGRITSLYRAHGHEYVHLVSDDGDERIGTVEYLDIVPEVPT